jgi:hypothetical protein
LSNTAELCDQAVATLAQVVGRTVTVNYQGTSDGDSFFNGTLHDGRQAVTLFGAELQGSDLILNTNAGDLPIELHLITHVGVEGNVIKIYRGDWWTFEIIVH